MNIYDVAELQQYLYPQGIDPINFQGAFRTNPLLNPMYFQGAYPTTYPKGIMTQAPIDFKRFEGITQETDIDDDTQDVVERKKKSSGILDLIGMFIPGFNFLRNLDGKDYQRFTPGYDEDLARSGIYKIGDFNQPIGLVNDFYDPITKTNRFDRAEEKFKKTGSLKDLFASSRSGAEFFRKRRELIDAQTKAAIAKRKAERDALQFISPVDTGPGKDPGPGKDTFDPSGGAGGTYDSSFDYGGSSKQAADRRSSDLGFSDIRLKENVELIGKSPSNINIYKFNYKNSPTTYQGVMAHEVPWANVKHNNGYMMVDYNRVDVEFKEWLK